jgi:hypothetical protein
VSAEGKLCPHFPTAASKVVRNYAASLAHTDGRYRDGHSESPETRSCLARLVEDLGVQTGKMPLLAPS